MFAISNRLSSLRALAAAACGPEKELGLLPLKAPSNSPTVSSDSSARWRKKRRGRGAGKPGIMTTDDVTTSTSVDLVCKPMQVNAQTS